MMLPFYILGFIMGVWLSNVSVNYWRKRMFRMKSNIENNMCEQCRHDFDSYMCDVCCDFDKFEEVSNVKN